MSALVKNLISSLEIISEFLPYSDALEHSLVSKSFNTHLISQKLWKYYLERDYPNYNPQTKETLFKNIYRLAYETYNKWRKGKFVLTSLETAHKYGVTCCLLHNNTVFSGSKDTLIAHWDPRRGVLLRTYEGHVNGVISIKVVGNTLISCCGKKSITIQNVPDSLIIIWDIETGKMLRKISNFGIASEMLATKQFIIVSTFTNSIKIFTLDGQLKFDIDAHEQWISSIKLLNDEILISSSYDGKICFWNLKNGKCINTIQCKTGITCFAVQDDVLVLGLFGGEIQIFENSKLMRTLELHRRLVSHISINKKKMIISASPGSLNLYENSKEYFLDKNTATCLQMDDDKLVVGFTDKSFKVFDLSTKQLLYSIENHMNVITDLHFEGEMLVIASNDATLSVYDFCPDGGFEPQDKNKQFELLLVDINKKVCDALSKSFAKHKRVKKMWTLLIVSPANSFGLMDGGVDAVITRMFGVQLQMRVQEHILKEYQGEQPVGTAFIIETGDSEHKYLAHCPTMRVPMDIRNTDYVYLAMKALLREIYLFNKKNNNAIKIVCCPGFGTLTGLMEPEEAARQMELALGICKEQTAGREIWRKFTTIIPKCEKGCVISIYRKENCNHKATTLFSQKIVGQLETSFDWFESANRNLYQTLKMTFAKVILLLIVSIAFVNCSHPFCILKTKEGTIDLNKASDEKGFEIQNGFETYSVNICKYASHKCDNKEYPSVFEISFGQDQCYPISSTLDAQNVEVKLIDEAKPSNGLVLKYKGGHMFSSPADTHITCLCDKNIEKTTLQYDECPYESNEEKYICKFTAKGAAFCPVAGCTICGLGVLGLIMVIAISLLIVYFIVGILINKFKYQASGMDLIPNVNFWKEIPLLVKDGVLFTIDTIKGLLGKKNYQQI